MTLQVTDLETYYGLSHILFAVSLEISAGEVVALLGRNGAGKTTTLRSIMGLTAPKKGRVTYEGQDITGMPAYRVAKLGIGFVPEDRRIFPMLTVRENMEIGEKAGPPNSRDAECWSIESVLKLFPRLEQVVNRRGGTLSGGEQQMLAIARTLLGNPRLLLLDEPTEGLAPIIVDTIGTLIQELRSRGVTILLSEQNVEFSLECANRAYIIDQGRIVYDDTIENLRQDADAMKRYLAV
jgi:branched-chain amino acid transport system ATP-binding protein